MEHLMGVVIFTLILILVIGYAIYALVKGGRKGAGGSATTMLGATDLMLNEDKKRAAQEVVQQRAPAVEGNRHGQRHQEQQRNRAPPERQITCLVKGQGSEHKACLRP